MKGIFVYRFILIYFEVTVSGQLKAMQSNFSSETFSAPTGTLGEVVFTFLNMNAFISWYTKPEGRVYERRIYNSSKKIMKCFITRQLKLIFYFYFIFDDDEVVLFCF